MKKFLLDDVKRYYQNYLIELFEEMVQETIKMLNEETNYAFSKIDVFREAYEETFRKKVVQDVLKKHGISVQINAVNFEHNIQISFIKKYLENHEVVNDDDNLVFPLYSRSNPLLTVLEWFDSLLIVRLRTEQDDFMQKLLSLEVESFQKVIFYEDCNNCFDDDYLLAEDAFYTGRRKNGSKYTYYKPDEEDFGNKTITGGSYAAVRYFNKGSKTHQTHHLIPVKFLKDTGIVSIEEGPSIRIKIEDHKKTKSYGYINMEDIFFQRQLNFLKEKNIIAAVNIEIRDLRSKYGDKYNDSIKQVKKYAKELQKKLLVN